MNDTGLIHAYLLDGEGGGQKLSWEQISAWTPEQGVIWVHLDYNDASSRDWLVNHSCLDELTQQSLLADETRPRCVSSGKGLLVNLRGVNSNPNSEPEDMVSIRLYCDENRIISTRRRVLLSVRDTAASIELGHGPKSAGDLLATLAHRLTERMSDVISDLDDAIDTVEEEIITGASQSYRGRLVELRREVIMLRRFLSPQREALARLQSENAQWLSESNRLMLRESGDRVIRYIEELDSSRDRAAVAYEELTSQLSEQINARMYILSVVAALFLPLGFLTGLFGINVGGIPFAENPWGFVLIILILLLMVGVQVVIFRMKKWF